MTVPKYHENAVYVYQTDVNESALTTGLDKSYLILANKTVVLGEDYIPSTLTELDDAVVVSWHESLELESYVAAALYEMLDEMKHAGINDVSVTSAYRSYARQQSLFNQYLSKEMSGISNDAVRCFGEYYIKVNYQDKGITKLSYEDALQVVLSYSARPGTSEHQTGLCVDLITDGMGTSLDESFEDYEAFAWLSENAYKFGFILRYPKGKENITGYTYEPWHYRFVGREAATDIHFSGLTLEEYLGAVEG